VGLSQSQMSRLESGQRRVDASLLSILCRALKVHPAHFFQDFGPPEGTGLHAHSDAAPPLKDEAQHVGRLIRSERRSRHLTAEELAKRIGRPRSWVQEIEAGKIELLKGELLPKLAKALKLDPALLFDAQRSTIRELRGQLQQLEVRLAEPDVMAPGGEVPIARGIPLLALGVKLELDEDGAPKGEVQDRLVVPDLAADGCFAILHEGIEMKAESSSLSVDEGEVLVFSIRREVRHRDLALAILPGGSRSFRQVFFDPRGVVRLQPLNLDYAALEMRAEALTALFRLVARVRRV